MADQLHPTGLDARGALAEGTPEAAEDRRLVQTPLQQRVANLTAAQQEAWPPSQAPCRGARDPKEYESHSDPGATRADRCVHGWAAVAPLRALMCIMSLTCPAPPSSTAPSHSKVEGTRHHCQLHC